MEISKKEFQQLIEQKLAKRFGVTPDEAAAIRAVLLEPA